MWSCPSRWMLAAVAALSLVTGTTGQATTSIPQGAVVEVDQATVNQILDVFHKADAAIAAGEPGRRHGALCHPVQLSWVETGGYS